MHLNFNPLGMGLVFHQKPDTGFPRCTRRLGTPSQGASPISLDRQPAVATSHRRVSHENRSRRKVGGLPTEVRSARAGWISVEAVVGFAVTGLSLIIFALIMITADPPSRHASARQGERTNASQPAFVGESNYGPASKEGGYRARAHEGLAFEAVDQTSDRSDTKEVASNGITVLTPPLLVPVVNLDEPESAVSTTDGSDHKYSGARTHRHRRAHVRGHRKVEYRIVGLSSNRRRVAVRY